MKIDIKFTVERGIKYNHHIKFDHALASWLFVFALLYFVSWPLSLIGMFLVGDSPFWMWQIIFMFFGLLFLGRK